jgi:hypothetical protein
MEMVDRVWALTNQPKPSQDVFEMMHRLGCSQRVDDRRDFFLVGLELCGSDRLFTDFYGSEFNSECYRKVVVRSGGTTEYEGLPDDPFPGCETMMPCHLFFLGDPHAICVLRGGDGRDLLIAHNPVARERNGFWEAVKYRFPLAPALRGDLVFFRWQRALPWSVEDLVDELRNYFEHKMQHKTKYIFSF